MLVHLTDRQVVDLLEDHVPGAEGLGVDAQRPYSGAVHGGAVRVGMEQLGELGLRVGQREDPGPALVGHRAVGGEQGVWHRDLLLDGDLAGAVRRQVVDAVVGGPDSVGESAEQAVDDHGAGLDDALERHRQLQPSGVELCAGLEHDQVEGAVAAQAVCHLALGAVPGEPARTVELADLAARRAVGPARVQRQAEGPGGRRVLDPPVEGVGVAAHRQLIARFGVPQVALRCGGDQYVVVGLRTERGEPQPGAQQLAHGGEQRRGVEHLVERLDQLPLGAQREFGGRRKLRGRRRGWQSPQLHPLLLSRCRQQLPQLRLLLAQQLDHRVHERVVPGGVVARGLREPQRPWHPGHQHLAAVDRRWHTVRTRGDRLRHPAQELQPVRDVDPPGRLDLRASLAEDGPLPVLHFEGVDDVGELAGVVGGPGGLDRAGGRTVLLAGLRGLAPAVVHAGSRRRRAGVAGLGVEAQASTGRVPVAPLHGGGQDGGVLGEGGTAHADLAGNLGAGGLELGPDTDHHLVVVQGRLDLLQFDPRRTALLPVLEEREELRGGGHPVDDQFPVLGRQSAHLPQHGGQFPGDLGRAAERDQHVVGVELLALAGGKAERLHVLADGDPAGTRPVDRSRELLGYPVGDPAALHQVGAGRGRLRLEHTSDLVQGPGRPAGLLRRPGGVGGCDGRAQGLGCGLGLGSFDGDGHLEVDVVFEPPAGAFEGRRPGVREREVRAVHDVGQALREPVPQAQTELAQLAAGHPAEAELGGHVDADAHRSRHHVGVLGPPCEGPQDADRAVGTRPGREQLPAPALDGHEGGRTVRQLDPPAQPALAHHPLPLRVQAVDGVLARKRPVQVVLLQGCQGRQSVRGSRLGDQVQHFALDRACGAVHLDVGKADPVVVPDRGGHQQDVLRSDGRQRPGHGGGLDRAGECRLEGLDALQRHPYVQDAVLRQFAGGVRQVRAQACDHSHVEFVRCRRALGDQLLPQGGPVVQLHGPGDAATGAHVRGDAQAVLAVHERVPEGQRPAHGPAARRRAGQTGHVREALLVPGGDHRRVRVVEPTHPDQFGPQRDADRTAADGEDLGRVPQPRLVAVHAQLGALAEEQPEPVPGVGAGLHAVRPGRGLLLQVLQDALPQFLQPVDRLG